MAGERTPDTTPANYKGSSDDEISLREHLQRQLDAQRFATSERISSEHEFFEQRLSDITTLLNERYDRQTEALSKAESAIEKRFDSVNEFRAQLNDQAHSFMPRSESISRHERTQEQMEKMEQHFLADIAAINRRLDTQQGIIQGQREQKDTGRNTVIDLRAWIALGITVILAAITIAAFVIANSGNG